MQRILAADIGGTHGRFAAFSLSPDGGLAMLDQPVWLFSAGAGSLGELLAALAAEAPGLDPRHADMAALAVAGPVRANTFCDPPNIAWSVDLSEARIEYGMARHVLINDFAAQAFAVRTPAMDGAVEVLPGSADPDGNVAVLGPGTGLGKAVLAPDGRGGWVALSTEGGHCLFPFSGEREFAFQEFVRARTGRGQVIGDMVVSGGGLSALHAFFTGEELAPPRVAARLADEPEVLEWAARFLGRACREAALEHLAMGGVVVSGGVAARVRELTSHVAFAREFRFSETHAPLLERMPVRLNICEDAGLWGAAFAGAQALRRG
ncbi:glucokinase [Desulfocurvus sp. DL9XJH121]